ncbi:hypothetical protein [Chryseobacterium sp.]|uniref:hypothetical protein n=1 Tax=Chryseobacterium sp. TaxID=1871047 RepID=UPI00388F7C90
MKQLFLVAILVAIVNTSCATEKLNTSPLSSNFYSEAKTAQAEIESNNEININIRDNVNASEITNLISTFPNFKNKGLNEQIQILKYNLQNYLYAIDAGNRSGKNRNIKSVEKSYKNIQKLRSSLDNDDNELLNRYLVKIKTNVSVIEDSVNGNGNKK